VRNELHLPDASFHKHDPVSDDGIRFSIVDLPGVADSENSKAEESFDEMTREYAAKCDVVCWVTDIRTAFLTSHEKTEFDKIKEMLSKLSLESGKLYQIFVMLAKYDMDGQGSDGSDGDGSGSTTPMIIDSDEPEEIESDSDELSVEYEDTTVRDCLKRVESLFEGTDTKLMKFNAFGRIIHCGKSTPKLKSLVKKIAGYVSKHNIRFDVAWIVDEFAVKQQRCYLNTLINYHHAGLAQVRYRDKLCDSSFHGSCSVGNAKINEIIQNITDRKIINDMLRFIIIDSESALQSFSAEVFHVRDTYKSSKWNVFAYKIKPQKHLEHIDSIHGKMIKDFASKVQLYRLMKILGPMNKAVQQLYIVQIKTSKSFRMRPCQHIRTSIGFTDPCEGGLSNEDGPEFYNMDRDFRDYQSLSINKKWLSKLKQHRIDLWGEEAENNVDLYMLLMNVWHGKVRSIFAPFVKDTEFMLSDDETETEDERLDSDEVEIEEEADGDDEQSDGTENDEDEQSDVDEAETESITDEEIAMRMSTVKKDTYSNFAIARGFRRFVVDTLGDRLKPLDEGVLLSAVWKLLIANNMNDVASMKTFDSALFVSDYNEAIKKHDSKKIARDVAKIGQDAVIAAKKTAKESVKETMDAAILEAVREAAKEVATEIAKKCHSDMLIVKDATIKIAIDAAKRAVVDSAEKAVIDAVKKIRDNQISLKRDTMKSRYTVADAGDAVMWDMENGDQIGDQSKFVDYITALEKKIYQMLEKDKKDTENMTKEHRKIYLEMAHSRNMRSLDRSEWDVFFRLERKWKDKEKEGKWKQAKYQH